MTGKPVPPGPVVPCLTMLPVLVLWCSGEYSENGMGLGYNPWRGGEGGMEDTIAYLRRGLHRRKKQTKRPSAKRWRQPKPEVNSSRGGLIGARRGQLDLIGAT